MHPTPVSRLAAPAKLTLSLRITGTRSDGYHTIDAEMVTLDLHDVLTITADESTAVEVTGRFADGVPTGPGNLVARALELCGHTARVTIEKQIPHGGGLGGGSADAAAVLTWAGFDDLVTASRLGADIPFCMVGGRARVTGIGEIVEPLTPQHHDITLVIPPLHVATPAVYRAYDELSSRPSASPDGPAGSSGVNDLEAAAFIVEPGLMRWRDRIREITSERPVLAGSGATFFVYGKHGNALAVLDNEGAEIRQVRTTP